MKRRVCITGIGIINPSGIGKENFWNKVSIGTNSISKITRFPVDNFPIQIAGQLSDFDVSNFISKRLAIKTDTFTHYALAATKLAIQDSNIDLKAVDPYKIGVWLGNNAGGWDICERGLFELYNDGPSFANPWQATAWFLSAPQGYITIEHNIKGISKSFVCDRASSACAIYFAIRSIQNGQNDIIISGGTEAPITGFAMTCYFETGEMASSQSDLYVYKPFDKNRRGYLLGEGSTILILEEYESAKKRGANIYGELVSAVMSTDLDKSSHQQLENAQNRAIKTARMKDSDIDFILAEGSGTPISDLMEAKAILKTFKNRKVPVTCPKSSFGHLYGASTATDIARGLLAIENELIPPTPNFSLTDDSIDLNIVKEPTEMKVKNFLVNSRSSEGCNVSLIVKDI